MNKEIPELYAFTDEKIQNMEQKLIDEVVKKLKEIKKTRKNGKICMKLIFKRIYSTNY